METALSTSNSTAALTQLPSIESLLQSSGARQLIEEHGRSLAVEALRASTAEMRDAIQAGHRSGADAVSVVTLARERLAKTQSASLRPVINLTGTVLHTNLGRGLLPECAVAAVVEAATRPVNLEFDVETGERGERDDHTETWLRRLTGAEAATLVNNNAAAVLLVLNTFALRKEVLVSRGELIEIGGSFRLPEIMARAGARLREVGTTNRTHLRDFTEAIEPRTGLIMKVHASNYRIEGFTKVVDDRELAGLAREGGIPYVVDLGSGSLADLARFGLPPEPMPRDALAAGADLVTFSGDKLLGGPQAGLIVGRADLIERINCNPLKRALRCDKMTIAALGALLPLYADPDRLAERHPMLRQLTRPLASIREAADRLRPPLAQALEPLAGMTVIDCASQIGSGALPIDLLRSAGLRLVPSAMGRSRKLSARRLAAALRRLPVPVIGRIQKGAVILDLRCLTAADETVFVEQLPALPALLEEATGGEE